jgi:hypothetical protein
LPVAELSRDHSYELSLTRRFVYIGKRRVQSVTSRHRGSLPTTTRAQVSVSLRKTVN